MPPTIAYTSALSFAPVLKTTLTNINVARSLLGDRLRRGLRLSETLAAA